MHTIGLYLHITGAYLLKPECLNRSTKLDFLIIPNSFYQLSVDLKSNDNSELELNDQHDQWTTTTALPFSQSLSTGMGLY